MTLGALLLGTALAGTIPPTTGLRANAWRPTLSGDMLHVDSDDGFFRVHYTLDGADRPAGGVDDDGVPVTVRRTLAALEESRALYDARGWRALIGDDGAGGSDALDVYLQRVDINGYAHGVEVAGESGRGGCWIEVDGALGGSGGRVLESVVVHEVHHCVQYRYTWSTPSWLHESQSSYEQYLWDSDGALSVALVFLWQTRLQNPEWAIDDLRGRYEYAGLTFVKFWEEYQGRDGVRGPALWEALGERSRWERGLQDAAEATFGESLDDTFLSYATWMAFACGRDDGQRWEDDAVWCFSAYETPVTSIDADTAVAVAWEDTPYTAAYLEVGEPGADETAQVACDAPGAGARLGVRVVALDADGVGGEEASGWADDDAPVSVTLRWALPEGGRALVALVSTGEQPAATTCTATWVPGEVPAAPPGDPDDDVAEACACATGPGSGAWTLPSFLVFGALRRRSPRVTRNRPARRNPGLPVL